MTEQTPEQSIPVVSEQPITTPETELLRELLERFLNLGASVDPDLPDNDIERVREIITTIESCLLDDELIRKRQQSKVTSQQLSIRELNGKLTMAHSERYQVGLAMADQDERIKGLTEAAQRLQDDNEALRLRCSELEQEAIALQERSLTMHPAADLERASQETIELRAQLNQAQDEIKALRSWKDGKLKTDTNRRADADRARRERDAVQNDLNAERDQNARTVRALRGELKQAMAKIEEVRQREAALATREEQLNRSTQIMLKKRAQDAVAKREDLRTIVITTRAVHDALIKQGQDPVQALPGPNFGALLLELFELALKFAPKAALSTLLLRFLPGSDSQEPTLTLQRTLVDARVWLHQIGMHIEVMTGQLGIFQGKYAQASAALNAREETLRTAWQLILETEHQVQKFVGRIDNAQSTTSRHERGAGH